MAGPSLETWLSARENDVPEELRTHIRTAVRDALRQPVNGGGIGALVTGAHDRLHVLLAGDATSRDAALDLLTVDALLTYALEALASERVSIDEHVVSMLREIASIDVPPEEAS